MTTGRLWALGGLLAALCVAAAGKGSPEQDRELQAATLQQGAGGGRRAGVRGHLRSRGAQCLAPPPRPRPLRPVPRPPAGDILVRFRDSIPNWAAVKAEGHLEGWDDATPTYLWSGVILDFQQRVRIM